MSRIPRKDDEPTYRRNSIRRRGVEDPVPLVVEKPAAEKPAAAPPAAAKPAAAKPAAEKAAPAKAAPPRPAPAADRAEPPARRPAPPPKAAPLPFDRPSLDGDALLAELDAFDPAEMARLLGQGGAFVLEPGDEVTGTVARITHDTVFVDIGGKSEAWLPLSELDGAAVEPGQDLTARVLSSGGGGVRLTRHLGAGAGLEALESAMEAGVPVDGRVDSRNTGGFVIAMGGLRAFCPVSHIDRHPAPDLDSYLGRTLPFRILEVRGKDVVVSHKAVAAEEAERQAEKLWATLQPGDALEGVVTGERPFGVFVDIGGLTGLVHKSELSWGDEATMPAAGTRVQVRVVEIDAKARRISLSMKDEAMGPWARVGTEILEGEVYPGKVVRLADFGAFVELLPGLQGLAHISTLADRRIGHPSEVLAVGQVVQVRVLSVDRERERLELGLKQAAEGWEPDAGEAGYGRGGEAGRGRGGDAGRGRGGDAGRGRGGASHTEGASLGTLADLLSGLKLKR
ncbi:S1 RNA-binding domain-containing protein [Myxococcota bacterium]|nr:S1 RNA-binding domain-containing protein [Myxococcota bacterium]